MVDSCETASSSAGMDRDRCNQQLSRRVVHESVEVKTRSAVQHRSPSQPFLRRLNPHQSSTSYTVCQRFNDRSKIDDEHDS